VTRARKHKISITVPGDLLHAIDHDAAAERRTRSGVIEAWLRRAAFVRAREELEAATEAYYLAMTAEERSEAAEIGKSLSRASRRLRIDR
jgi:metal-responsive CopG/Arc/MetJ family transcriptional regulator